MLRRGKNGNLLTVGYLVSVQVEEGGATSTEQIANRLSEGLTWLDDVGEVTVDCLGQVDVYPEQDSDV